MLLRTTVGPKRGKSMSNEVTFVTVFESGYLELLALRLVESLRQWGRKHADSPFLFVKPRPGPGPGRETRRRMLKLGVDYCVAASTSDYEWYNFLNKPVALREAQAVVGTPIICWLDGDVLVLDEPSLLDLRSDVDLAVCAPDITVGTFGPGSRYEAYWDTYCKAIGFSLDDLGWVRPCWHESRIRSYFNGGVMSIRASSGFIEEYYKTVVAALDARLASSTDGIFMHEQMAIGVAARRLHLHICELPLSYNYSCYELDDPSGPESRACELILLHYHEAFWPNKYDGMLNRIAERRPDRVEFVLSLGPIKMRRLNPLSRLYVRLLRRGRQRSQETYIATCQKIETPPVP